MKRMIKIAGLALAIAFSTATAQAQDIKPYAGVGLGYFAFDVGLGYGTMSTIGYFGQIGADFGDYFGAELRAGATQEADKTVGGINLKLKLSSFISYLGKLQYPVSDQLKIYALAGGTTAKATATASVPSLAASASTTTTAGSFGGGVSFNANDNIRVGAEWMRYASDTSAFSGTIQYSF